MEENTITFMEIFNTIPIDFHQFETFPQPKPILGLFHSLPNSVDLLAPYMKSIIENIVQDWGSEKRNAVL